MSLHYNDRDFYGRQEGEVILYVVHPHPLATTFGLLKVYLIAVIVSVILVTLGAALGGLMALLIPLGLLFFVLTIVVGTKVVINWQVREVAYITDRRIVRFEPTTLFATNSRTLAWDEIVKIKTYPPNFFWKQMAIGTVAIHGRTSIRTVEDIERGTSTVDDIEIQNVYLYRDLGNYLDKILFTFKQRPDDMSRIRPFIPRPKGQRY